MSSWIHKMRGVVFIFILGISCSDENQLKTESAFYYFPLRNGNEWSYRVDQINASGEIESSWLETWKMRDDTYLDYFEKDGDYGYRIMYQGGDGNIYDVVGKFLTTEFLNESEENYFLISSRLDPIPSFHWMRGGKNVITTLDGLKECIYAKDSLDFGSALYPDPIIRNYTFCKGIGLIELSELYLTLDEFGYVEPNPFLTRKWTLTSYDIK
jgi:hypothetical protein